MSKPFSNDFFLPPFHERCRCGVLYEETGLTVPTEDGTMGASGGLGVSDSELMLESILDNNYAFLNVQQQQELYDILKPHSENALNLYSKLSTHFPRNDYHYTDDGAAYWPKLKKVRMNINNYPQELALGNGRTGAWLTKFHEEFHQLDDILGAGSVAFTHTSTSTGSKMVKAIQEDVLSVLNTSIHYYNQKYEASLQGLAFPVVNSLSQLDANAKIFMKVYLQDTYVSRSQKAEICMFTDALGLVTQDVISPHEFGFWGHDSVYNKNTGFNGATSETWATFCAAYYCGDEALQSELKALMPRTWETYHEVLEEVFEFAKANELSY